MQFLRYHKLTTTRNLVSTKVNIYRWYLVTLYLLSGVSHACDVSY